MATYTPVYPPDHTGTYVNVSNYLAGFYGYNATDPALSKTGTQTGNCWLANFVACKFNIDFGSAILPGRIYLENAHNSGSYTANGIKDFEVYGTNSATAFANLTYSNTTDLDLLGSFTALEHAAVDALSPQYFVLTNSTNYRYIVLRLSTSYSVSYMGIRHIEIQEPDATPLRVALTQPYNFRVGDAVVAQTVNQSYLLTDRILADVSFSWGLKMGADLVQPWSNAPVITANIFQPYGNAGVLTSSLIQRWRDAVPLLMQMVQPYALTTPLINIIRQPWALTADPVQALLAQGWNVSDINQVVAVLSQPYALAADGAIVPGPVDPTGEWLPGTLGADGLPITSPPPASGSVWRYGLEVLANGLPVRVSHCNIEGDLGQDVLTCELHLGAEAEYLCCPIGAALAVTVTSQGAAESFVFVVTAPRIEEQHGSTTYIVEAMSPAVLLGEPYAEPVDGPLTGLTSTLAASLAAPVPLTWQTVEWSIPSSTWIASGETPLALLKTLAASVGAVVQSSPDGSIRILPEYPEQWRTAAAAGALTEILDTFTAASTPEQRPGYNRYLIGSQMGSSDTLRLEETTLSPVLKEVRGYQVPWTGSIALAHTGGDWVLIEPMGVEERQETETVELVGGAGRVSYPLYAVSALDWQEINLGSITTAEDGSLQATVAGESLLDITYTTRCLLWRVRDPQNEKLQMVAEL